MKRKSLNFCFYQDHDFKQIPDNGPEASLVAFRHKHVHVQSMDESTFALVEIRIQNFQADESPPILALLNVLLFLGT